MQQREYPISGLLLPQCAYGRIYSSRGGRVERWRPGGRGKGVGFPCRPFPCACAMLLRGVDDGVVTPREGGGWRRRYVGARGRGGQRCCAARFRRTTMVGGCVHSRCHTCVRQQPTASKFSGHHANGLRHRGATRGARPLHALPGPVLRPPRACDVEPHQPRHQRPDVPESITTDPGLCWWSLCVVADSHTQPELLRVHWRP